MSDRWMNLPEAAVALQISTRLLSRRIKKGDYRTRFQPDGRREVLVGNSTPVAGSREVNFDGHQVRKTAIHEAGKPKKRQGRQRKV